MNLYNPCPEIYADYGNLVRYSFYKLCAGEVLLKAITRPEDLSQSKELVFRSTL